ncbi:MAG TPA: four helix bundle protein [Chthoniobacterales bacterium]|nr:four helix bundle protein [Chthoniobacterales bacterium]
MKDEKDDLRKRTKRFALRVSKVYETLPRNGSAQVLGHQLLRSGTSVGANFREAHRARSDAEFVSKVGDSLKELEETAYWLELLAESGAVGGKKLSLLLDETSQPTAILTSIAKKIRSRL